MKTVLKKNSCILMVLSFLFFLSCDKTEEPPVVIPEDPELSISPTQLTFNGKGGENTVTFTTNVAKVECTYKPDWVESVTFSPDFKTATVKVKENAGAGSGQIREDKLVFSTISDAEYETDANILLVQGIENGNIFSETFEKATAPTGWVIAGTASKVKYDNGFVELTSIGHDLTMNQTRLICKLPNSEVLSGVPSAGNVVYSSVDFQPSSGEVGMGMCMYLNDSDPTNFFQYFVVMGATTGTMWAFDKGITGNPAALGDPIPGDPFNWGGTKEGLPLTEAIPTAGIDGYYRMEITNSYNLPYWWQYQVSIWSLQTAGGLTKKHKLHYTRKFETNSATAIPLPGYFGIWVKGADGTMARFKNFRLSFQKN
jgi:hypothetical protein